MADYMKDDGKVREVAERVIKNNMPNLANIEIGYQFLDKARNSKGRTIYAEINKVPGKLENFIDYDLILTVAEDKWAAAKEIKTREAIIDDVLRTVHLEEKEGTAGFPRRLADDWYLLSDGKKIKGQKAAEEAQQNISDYDIKIYGYEVQANPGNFKKYGAWRKDLEKMKTTVLQPNLPLKAVGE
ncbi:putative metallopeptidase [Orenia marismortui]|uniref:putative metallopeptidase n=1 Tax=Orenia marismortui TaxID=46469 RepID=UPI0003706A47|nr:putative metallopeptidase [Orenia marismortui]